MRVTAAKDTLAAESDSSVQLADYDKTYRTFDWKSVEASFTWHQTGRVNMAHEAIDRHVIEGRGERLALAFTDGVHRRTLTFAELSRRSNRFAHVLAARGVGRGDRVGVFLPRSPDAAIGILGALKLGAIPTPISDAFSGDAVRDRLADAGAVALLTRRDLLARVPDEAWPELATVVVTGGGAGAGHVDFEAAMAAADDAFDVVWLGREDPLILHYTPGTSGRPKGALHVQAAMLGHLQTGRWVMDLRPGDVSWCTAHPGRVTGTSYGLFAPWLCGAATVMFAGPLDADEWYRTIETLRVSVWFAAPPAFRALAAAGAPVAARHDLSSLRHVLSTGEPLGPELVRWGRETLGRRIHDTWLMTETGHQLIANYRSVAIRPGSMGKPIPGVEVAILDPHGHRVPPRTLGLLCVKRGWPGMMRRVWNDPARTGAYERFPGWTWSGDTAMYDEDGYFWFQGRADEVLEIDGERIGPFEIESTIATHPAVVDAGVIGVPDARHGRAVRAFVSLRAPATASDALKREIAEHVRRRLAAHAAPREVTFVAAVPRAANGRIDRRALQRLARAAPAPP